MSFADCTVCWTGDVMSHVECYSFCDLIAFAQLSHPTSSCFPLVVRQLFVIYVLFDGNMGQTCASQVTAVMDPDR